MTQLERTAEGQREFDKNCASLDPRWDRLQAEIDGDTDGVETAEGFIGVRPGDVAEAIGFVVVGEIPENIELGEE